MRLVLVGDFRDEVPDEGMRQLSRVYLRAATSIHDAVAVSTADFCSGRALGLLRNLEPEVIHYVTGPSFRSLVAMRTYCSLLKARPITIATGLRPVLRDIGRRMLPLVAPDYYLAQATSWEGAFRQAGSRVIPWPNPVDLERFAPIDSTAKGELRRKWGFSERPVVLHVGHIKDSRRLDNLVKISRSGRYEVIVVGSPSLSRRGRLWERLEGAGCRLVTDFVEDIQEVYQACDVYLFPVAPSTGGSRWKSWDAVGSMDFPLSVLEAMGCNLPVVATRLEALDRFIPVTPGFRFYDGTCADAMRCLRDVLGEASQTRAAVQEYGLEAFSERLGELYRSVASGMPEVTRAGDDA